MTEKTTSNKKNNTYTSIEIKELEDSAKSVKKHLQLNSSVCTDVST